MMVMINIKELKQALVSGTAEGHYIRLQQNQSSGTAWD